jgi:hypothetical protein
MYWITSSRRWCSKSTSMSGGSLRSLGDEALEEHRHAARVHLGDAQAIADRGVGGRATPLAKDVLAPREGDDVLHGEEERLVAKLGDERELVLHRADHRFGRALRIAPREPFVGERAQVRGGRLAARHELFRVFVADLVERKPAAARQVERGGQVPRGMQRREPADGAQVSLAVRMELAAHFGERAFHADRRHHVLELFAIPGMHVHVARGEAREAGLGRELFDLVDASCVVGAAMQLDGSPCVSLETRGDPAALLQVSRKPDRFQPFGRLRDVFAREAVAAFPGGAAARGDELAHRFIAANRRGEERQLQAIGERDLRADDELDAELLRFHVRAHDAGHRAFIGDRDGAIAQFGGAMHDLFGTRRAAQEAEAREAMQLRVAGNHANTPCRYQPWSPRCSRKIQYVSPRALAAT